MKQFILYYPLGSTFLESGEEVSNNILARQILEDLKDGKHVALERNSGGWWGRIPEGGISVFDERKLL